MYHRRGIRCEQANTTLTSYALFLGHIHSDSQREQGLGFFFFLRLYEIEVTPVLPLCRFRNSELFSAAPHQDQSAGSRCFTSLERLCRGQPFPQTWFYRYYFTLQHLTNSADNNISQDVWRAFISVQVFLYLLLLNHKNVNLKRNSVSSLSHFSSRGVFSS